jgi:hypothetical protein
MKVRLSDNDLDRLMENAIKNYNEFSIAKSNLVIVELLNRLLDNEKVHR